jgi:hypothetical protein
MHNLSYIGLKYIIVCFTYVLHCCRWLLYFYILQFMADVFSFFRINDRQSLINILENKNKPRCQRWYNALKYNTISALYAIEPLIVVSQASRQRRTTNISSRITNSPLEHDICDCLNREECHCPWMQKKSFNSWRTVLLWWS